MAHAQALGQDAYVALNISSITRPGHTLEGGRLSTTKVTGAVVKGWDTRTEFTLTSPCALCSSLS